MRFRTALAVLAVSATLGACSATQSPDPVGPGRGADELKTSPCACVEIPMKIPADAGRAPEAV